MRRLTAVIAFGAAVAAAEPTYKHGVSFFGKFKYPPDFEHFDYVNADAPKGGMLVLATGANWNSFTPYLNKGVVVPGVQHSMGSQPFLYDGLFVPADDEIGTFYGNLAESVMVADDFSWVRFRLRPEAHWHDGVPITARDVKFTFDYIRYDYYRDGTVLREGFRKGLVDYRRETDPRYWFTGYDIPARHKGWIVMRQHNFQYYVGLMRGIVINERRENLKDPRLREALTLAFDYCGS